MFDGLLRALVESVPGARGAVFCDGLGESVSAVGTSGRFRPDAMNDYDLRVTGAQVSTPLERLVGTGAELGVPTELVLRGERETLVVHPLKDGYYLVVCLSPEALASRATVAARALASRLAEEL